MWPWVLAVVGGVVVLIGAAQYRAGRGVYTPLTRRQPPRTARKVPLGMEALDLEGVARTTRRNESLERGQTNWLRRSGYFGRSDTDVPALSDDETYAARYYDAFHKDK
jgi:hypothetical protein